MGYYINQISSGRNIFGEGYKGKIDALISDGALLITKPSEWREGIICVVDNGGMAAAAYAYSPSELEAFKRPDGRPKTWLYLKNAKELAK